MFVRKRPEIIIRTINLTFINLSHRDCCHLYRCSRKIEGDYLIKELSEKISESFVSDSVDYNGVEYSIDGFVKIALAETRRIVGLENDDLLKLYHRLQALEHDYQREHNRYLDLWEFFNEPAAVNVDQRWASSLLNAEEAAALSFEKAPSVVNMESLGALRGRDSPFKIEFHHRMLQIERAITAGHLKHHFTWKNFLDWARREGIETKDPFSRSSPSEDPSSANIEAHSEIKYDSITIDDLDKKRIRSIALIISGLVKIKYKSLASRNLMTRITNDLDDVGISINRSTVESVIKEMGQLAKDRLDEVKARIRADL